MAENIPTQDLPASSKDVGTALATTPQKKDSTNELPMFGLEEAITFVASIHDKALETVPMPEVARGMGYTHPSSTPFYRRITAARMFGLLSKSGAELTLRAKDYLKPDREEAKSAALRDAISGIQPYSDEVLKHGNKKLNTQFVANGFAKTFSLTDGCANTCAKAFESSLKFAGMLSSDGVVIPAGTPPTGQTAQVEGALATKTPPAESSDDVQSHTLYLDKGKVKKFAITAPLEVSKQEFERIKKWLEAVLNVSDEQQAQQ